MNDERLAPVLRSWLTDSEIEPADPRHSAGKIMARVDTAGQRGRWWPLHIYGRPPVSAFLSTEPRSAYLRATSGPAPAGGLTVFSTLRFIAAAVIVALFGGFLLAGILTTPQGDEMAPAAVTESPSPMTTEELLSGMVTEEVEPGVFRVVNEGVRDLSSLDGWLIFAGQDGSIWLEVMGDLVRIGHNHSHDPRTDEAEGLTDLEVAPDGTAWAAIVSEDGSSRLRSFDGETWTTLPVVDATWEGHEWPFIEVTPSGRVWAASASGIISFLESDGPSWQTNGMLEAGVLDFGALMGFVATDSDVWMPGWNELWHYADGAWERITYGDPNAGAMPDDVFWALGDGDTGSHDILYRHDGSGWQRWTLEEQGMTPFWGASPWDYALAPDGSFWAGWNVAVQDGDVTESHCDGVSRFDGLTWTRFLPGTCIGRLDITPDGSVWLTARDGEDPGGGADNPHGLYVITPEAVAAEK